MKLINKSFIIALLCLISNTLSSATLDLHFIKSNVFEENDSLPIYSINNSSISSNNHFIAFPSRKYAEEVIIYSLDSLKIFASFKAESYLSDSILSQVIHHKSEYKTVPLEYHYYDFNINNVFSFAKFHDNNSIDILADLQYVTILRSQDFSTPSNYHISKATTILNYNLHNKQIKFTVFNNTRLPDSLVAFTQIDFFIYDSLNKVYYMSTSNDENDFSIAKYNEKGNFLSIVHNFPEELHNSFPLYFANFDIKSELNSNSELIVAYPCVDKIYNVTTHTYFELKNLKYDNKNFYHRFLHDSLFADSIKNIKVLEMKLIIKNLFIDKKDRIIVHYEHYLRTADEPIISQHLQVYDKIGNLLAEKEIENKNDIGKLEHIAFDKNTDKYYLFRKGAENWVLETYQGMLK